MMSYPLTLYSGKLHTLHALNPLKLSREHILLNYKIVQGDVFYFIWQNSILYIDIEQHDHETTTTELLRSPMWMSISIAPDAPPPKKSTFHTNWTQLYSGLSYARPPAFEYFHFNLPGPAIIINTIAFQSSTLHISQPRYILEIRS